MILSIADFPETTDTQSLQNAIALAESLAQGVDGSNRQLEITEYVEVFDYKSKSIYLSYFPIVNPESITVYQRGATNELFGMEWSVAEWELVPESNYYIDTDNNELFINNQNTGFGNLFTYYPRNPMQRRRKSQIKVRYSAGFDFTVESPITNSIKSNLISFANQVKSVAISQGIKSFEIDDEGHKTTYATASESAISSSGNNAIALILKSFHQYRPRTHIFS